MSQAGRPLIRVIDGGTGADADMMFVDLTRGGELVSVDAARIRV